MTLNLSHKNLNRWISEAIDCFKAKDLLGVPEAWLQIYDSLSTYISTDTVIDDKLMWMIEGTDEALPDVIYQLQRLKNALVAALIKDSVLDQLEGLLSWFDRLIVILVEKDSGKMSREHSLSKPYETIFWKARDGMYISTIEGRFLHCNESLLKMLKYKTLEDALKMDIVGELYVDNDERQLMLDHLMKDGFFDHHEFKFQTVDGEQHTAMESCYMVTATGGKQYIVGIMVDMTREKEELRKGEQYIKGIEKNGMETLLDLRRKTRRFEALLSLNDHPVLMMDPKDFLPINCNKAFTKRFKLGRKQLNSFCFRDLFTTDEWMRVFTQISQSAHRHHYHIRGVTCLAPDGSFFSADLSMWVHEDDEGAILFTQIEDRDDIMRIKDMLFRSRQNLEDMVNAIPVGVMGFKSDGNVGLINTYLQRFTGYTSKQLRNISFLNRLFAQDEQRLKFQKYIRRFINGHHAENVDVELKARNGECLTFKLTTLSYQFDHDDKPGFLAILNDVTDQVSLEKIKADQSRQPSVLAEEYHDMEVDLANIQSVADHLRHMNLFRLEFIDKVTKKFKAPIHMVLGYASLLKKELADRLSPSQQEDMNIVESHTASVLTMLNKAIEFANLDADNLPNEPATHVVRTMLDHLFKKLEPNTLSEGVTFKKEHQILSLELTVSVDQLLLESMLRHVVDNGVQHTTSGSITISGYEERNRLWIEVQDSGCGISPMDMPQVFEPFFQSGTAPQTVFNHLGLGLSIAQKYADLTATSIEIFSRLNEGTRFVLCVGRLIENEPVLPKRMKRASP